MIQSCEMQVVKLSTTQMDLPSTLLSNNAGSDKGHFSNVAQPELLS